MSAAAGLVENRRGRVYRCAWCRCDGRVDGGLLYFAYVEHGGSVRAVPGDPKAWCESDGICPAHYDLIREQLRLLSSPYPSP